MTWETDVEPHASRAEDDLESLWAIVTRLTRSLDPDSQLAPVMGGGQTCKPSLALIFINPTHRNQSTRHSWEGPRYPFIGTRGVWKVLRDSGLFPMELFGEIERRTLWDERFADVVYGEVRNRNLYLTNVVKWTGPNGDAPARSVVEQYLDVLFQELALVQPKAIVTFGLLPFRALTGEDIRLGDVLNELRSTGRTKSVETRRLDCPIYPCYFPVGRGNPRGAVEILSALREELAI